MPRSKALWQHAVRLTPEEKKQQWAKFSIKDQMKAAESGVLLEEWMNLNLQPLWDLQATVWVCYFLYVSDIAPKDSVEKGKLIWLFSLSEQRFWVQIFLSVCVEVLLCSSLTSVDCWSLWSGTMNEKIYKIRFRFITLSYTFPIWEECSFQSLGSASSFSI